MTLVETTVSVGIAAVMLVFMAYLSIFGARSTAVMADQLIAQNRTAAGMEFVANQLRNASFFSLYHGDAGPTVTRVMMTVPDSAGNLTTQALAFDPSNQRLVWFANSNVTFNTGPGGKPLPSYTPGDGTNRAYGQFASAEIIYNSEYWVTVRGQFTYSGYATRLAGGRPQYGQFITDIIAKNHYLGQGVSNYAQDPGTSSPSSL